MRHTWWRDRACVPVWLLYNFGSFERVEKLGELLLPSPSSSGIVTTEVEKTVKAKTTRKSIELVFVYTPNSTRHRFPPKKDKKKAVSTRSPTRRTTTTISIARNDVKQTSSIQSKAIAGKKSRPTMNIYRLDT